MRSILVLGVMIVGVGTAAATATARSTVRTGTLAGKTVIVNNCPVDTPGHTCSPWRPLAGAKVTIVRTNRAGTPLPRTARTVTSDSKGRFALRLAAGTYRVTPLPNKTARGGATVIARVVAAKVTTIVVHFVPAHPKA